MQIPHTERRVRDDGQGKRWLTLQLRSGQESGRDLTARLADTNGGDDDDRNGNGHVHGNSNGNVKSGPA